MVWPVLSPLPYDEQERTILGHFLSLEPTPIVTFELVLALIALAVWWRQGRPRIDTTIASVQ
ncbi:hypothetical protein [Halalkalicoccus salilacus]|uniref:hypothetical protein n=1 Tax=Halalkalicoccus salilacus TaxID=3117459 RepID=UPI00300F3ACD